MRRNSIKGLGFQKLGFRVYKMMKFVLSLLLLMIVIVIVIGA